jgi:AraC family transcriptional regulator
MFFAIIGITPSEYARRRRLTLAARELTSGNAKVIDIALKYGYESPDSFTRAFRNVHGINPLAARTSGANLAAFPRISFYVSLKGRSVMDYRIIEKPGFTVAGRIRPFTTANKQNLVKIPEWWTEFIASPERQQLVTIAGNKPGAVTGGSMLGVCIGEGQQEEFKYAIVVELPKGKSPKPFETLEIPASTWAVFETTLDDIQPCWQQIYEEWFPSTGYEHSGSPELEVYLPGDMGNPVTKCQIWIPIIDKKKKR